MSAIALMLFQSETCSQLMQSTMVKQVVLTVALGYVWAWLTFCLDYALTVMTTNDAWKLGSDV